MKRGKEKHETHERVEKVGGMSESECVVGAERRAKSLWPRFDFQISYRSLRRVLQTP